MTVFAERFSQALEKSKVKIDVLSHFTGIPQDAIYQYKSGLGPVPGENEIKEISRILHVSPAWLNGEDVPMERQLNLPSNMWEIDYSKMQKIPLLKGLMPKDLMFAPENILGHIYYEVEDEPVTETSERKKAPSQKDEALIKH